MDVRSTYELFTSIFKDAAGAELVKVWSKAAAKPQFHQVSYLKAYCNFEKVFSSFPDEDVYFSFSSFKNRKHGKARICDLFNVYAFCVDVDYKCGRNAACAIEEAVMHLSLVDGFLRPAYIEYGNQFRLIYLIQGHLSGSKQFSGITTVLNALVKQLNAYQEFDFCAEAQGLNTFVRAAGTYNTKQPLSPEAKWVWDDAQSDYVFKVDYPVVSYYELDGESSRKTLSEYMDIVLGEFDRPAWYNSWKNSAKKKQKRVSHSLNSLNQARLHDIDVLQRHFDTSVSTTGYRDKLCFLHFVHAKLLYGNNEQAWDSMVKFNQNFRNPMLGKELKNVVASAIYKQYKYSNDSFAIFLGLDADLISSLDLSIGKKCSLKNKEYCRRYYAKKKKTMKTKKDQIQKREKSIIKLRKKKKTNAQICASLRLSMKTLERSLTKLIKEHRILSKKFTKKCKDLIEKKKESSGFAKKFSDCCTLIGQAAEPGEEDRLFSELVWFDELCSQFGAVPGDPERRCLKDGVDPDMFPEPHFNFGMSDDDMDYI